MHYYSHNIGDYRRDTAHLTLLEHGVYRQMLDFYYLNEQPLTGDEAKLMRSLCVRSADEMQAMKNVLEDFFELTSDGYIHKRCDKVIAAFHGKSEKAAQSAKARWAAVAEEKNANAMRSHTEGNANHKPITNNHKPIKTTTPIAPNGVSDSVFKDFVQLRKGLRAPVTDTAIKGLQREATKAQLSLEEVMVLCCQNGWRGFKAEWIDKKKTAGEKNRDVLSGLTRGLMGNGHANLLTN